MEPQTAKATVTSEHGAGTGRERPRQCSFHTHARCSSHDGDVTGGQDKASLVDFTFQERRCHDRQMTDMMD